MTMNFPAQAPDFSPSDGGGSDASASPPVSRVNQPEPQTALRPGIHGLQSVEDVNHILGKRVGESGSISIFLATASFVMIILVGLAVDLGGQVHTQQRARDLAAQAARTGGEQVQAGSAIRGEGAFADVARARTAAQVYLNSAGVAGTVSVAGGTTITVHTTEQYKTKFLGIIGINSMTVTGKASARLVRIVDGTER